MIARMKEHVYGKLRIIMLLILTACSALALTMDLNEAGRKMFDGGTIVGLFISIVLFLFYQKTLLIKTDDSRPGKILSVLLALIMILGSSYKYKGTATHLFSSIPRVMITVLYSAGYAIFFLAAIRWLFPAFDRFCHRDSGKLPKWKILRAFEDHPMRTSFFVMLACWAVYLVVQYPGVITIDAYDELRQYFGFESWSANASIFAKEGTLINTHHSVLHTILIGGFYEFFWRLGFPDLGIFLQSCIRLVLQGLALAYTIQYMQKRNVSIYYRLSALFFYSVMPYFGIYGVAVIKDSVFAVLFVLCFLYFVELIRAPKETMGSWRKCALASFTLLAMMLFRKNGMYVLLFIAPFVLIFMAKEKPFRFATAKAASILFIPIAVLLLIEGFVYPAFGIGVGSVREMLSLPFQQTARYCVEHADEVTEEERTVIEKVLDYETITTKYNPYFADPVKATYKNDATKDDLIKYFETWFKQFKKHPLTYVESTAVTAFGYFHPDIYSSNILMGSYAWYDDGVVRIPRYEEGVIEISEPAILKLPLRLLREASGLFRRLTAIGLMMSAGIPGCLWMLTLSYLNWKKQLRFCIPLVLQAGMLITFFASPVAGSPRYVIPLFYCMPLMLSVCAQVAIKKNDDTDKSKQLA